MKAEEKIPGGKLVCVEIEARDGRISSLRITGDFFLHPEEALAGLERSIIGKPASLSEREAESLLSASLHGAVLIGVTCADLAKLVRKAIG